MSEDQEKIEDAAAVVIAPPEGPIGQLVKGAKMAWATKKAAMAAYAVFFGVTAATANYVSDGMTVDQIQQQQTMEETITTLSKQAEQLKTKVIALQTLVVLLEGVHTDDAQDHEIPEHTHPDIVALTGVFGHDHDEYIGQPGPQGPQGPQGEVGPTGPQGEVGKTPIIVPQVNDSEEYKHKNPRNDTCAESCH